MSDIPSYLQDGKDLLSERGFATSNVWYHGTSSALVDSIQESGLKRSGDKAMKQAAKSTMATIGNSYTETIEPVFLTQSKELAYFWATQTVRQRSVRFEGQESPVVLEIRLPDEHNAKVRPDVGAASLLMLKEGEAYLAYVTKLYQDSGIVDLDIELAKADREEFLNKLGMAYYDYDIEQAHVSVINK